MAAKLFLVLDLSVTFIEKRPIYLRKELKGVNVQRLVSLFRRERYLFLLFCQRQKVRGRRLA